MGLYIIIAILSTILLYVGFYFIRFYILKEKSKISFREGIDLTNVPVVTFYSNGVKLNFMIDTGSDASFINSSALKKLKYKKTGKSVSAITASDNNVEGKKVILTVSYKTFNFEEEFVSMNLDSVFNEIKARDGVQLHGLLSSSFLRNHGYILDFKDLTAYTY